LFTGIWTVNSRLGITIEMFAGFKKTKCVPTSYLQKTVLTVAVLDMVKGDIVFF
jgi:hypothetical protein